MNTQNNLAIWISNISDIQRIPQTLIENMKLDDICIVTDKDISCPLYGIITPFHISFMNIKILFLSIEDYLNNKNCLRSTRLYFYNESKNNIEEIKE